MKRVRYTLSQILDFFEREDIVLVKENQKVTREWLEQLDKEYKIKGNFKEE